MADKEFNIEDFDTLDVINMLSFLGKVLDDYAFTKKQTLFDDCDLSAIGKILKFLSKKMSEINEENE